MNLSELIETHKGRRSYVDLERACGGTPSAKRLQQLVKQPIKNFPDPPTVEALARGLRVPQREVVLAAARSLGLDIHDGAPRLVQLLPAATGELSEEQAAAVAHLVDLIVSDPVRQLGSMESEYERAEDKAERRRQTEPTVAQVMGSEEFERRRREAAEREVAEALDALPDEADDPPPIQGRSTGKAARLTDEP